MSPKVAEYKFDRNIWGSHYITCCFFIFAARREGGGHLELFGMDPMSSTAQSFFLVGNKTFIEKIVRRVHNTKYFEQETNTRSSRTKAKIVRIQKLNIMSKTQNTSPLKQTTKEKRF